MTIQRNWKHMIHKTKKNTTKTQHNIGHHYVQETRQIQQKHNTILDTTMLKQTQIT
jgi:RNase P subunit RPR2